MTNIRIAFLLLSYISDHLTHFSNTCGHGDTFFVAFENETIHERQLAPFRAAFAASVHHKIVGFNIQIKVSLCQSHSDPIHTSEFLSDSFG